MTVGNRMKCSFCGSDTEERVKKGNLIVIAHYWCVDDRKHELNTKDIVDCLLYEDRIRTG